MWEGFEVRVAASKTARATVNPELRRLFHHQKKAVELTLEGLKRLLEKQKKKTKEKKKGQKGKAATHERLEGKEKKWPRGLVCPEGLEFVDAEGECLDVSAGLPRKPADYRYKAAPKKVGGKRPGGGKPGKPDDDDEGLKEPPAKKAKVVEPPKAPAPKPAPKPALRDDDDEKPPAKKAKVAPKLAPKPAAKPALKLAQAASPAPVQITLFGKKADSGKVEASLKRSKTVLGQMGSKDQ